MSKQNIKQIAGDFVVNYCIEHKLKPVSEAHLKKTCKYLEECFKHAEALMNIFYSKIEKKGKK
jgi:hypothetical protein